MRTQVYRGQKMAFLKPLTLFFVSFSQIVSIWMSLILTHMRADWWGGPRMKKVTALDAK